MRSIWLVISIFLTFTAVESRNYPIFTTKIDIPRFAWTPKNYFSTEYFPEGITDNFDQQINEYCDNPVLTDSYLEFVADAQSRINKYNGTIHDRPLNIPKLRHIFRMVCRMVYSRSDVNNDGLLNVDETKQGSEIVMTWLNSIATKINLNAVSLNTMLKLFINIPFANMEETTNNFNTKFEHLVTEVNENQ